MDNSNPQVENWPALLAAVESNAGIQRVTMETLRKLEGRQRVGRHILTTIEEKLATLGLGHLPQELPNRQQQSVLLYRQGTPASEVIAAVRDGLTAPASETAYESLHRLNAVPDPETVVSKEIVSDAVEQTARSLSELLQHLQTTGHLTEAPSTDNVVSLHGAADNKTAATVVSLPATVKALLPSGSD